MSEPVSYPERSAPHPVEPQGEALGELLNRYFALLRRFYWVLILAAVVCVGLAYLWTEQQTHVYEATSKLMFHETQPNLFGGEFEEVEFVDPHDEFERFWNSQRALLDSRTFVGRVVDSYGLADDPRLFDEEIYPQLTDDQRRRVAIDHVRDAAEYSLQRDSYVAVVDVQFDDPELAAEVADAIADSYVEHLHEYQSGGVEQLSEWFSDYVANQQEDLDDAHSRLQEYRRDNNILSLTFEERQEMTGDSLATIRNRLHDIRAELHAQESLRDQIVEIQQSDADPRVLGDLVDNDVLAEALREESALKRERARLGSRYLEDHPDVKAVDHELEATRQVIDEEIERIRASVENRAAVSRRNVERLEAERARLTEEIAALNEVGVDYQQLRNDVDTMRQHYEAVLDRTTEIDLNALYDREMVHVLERAEVPQFPISPRLPLNLAIGLLMGLFFGWGVVMLIDALDDTVQHPDDIAPYTDRPVLGTLPSVDKSSLKNITALGDSPVHALAHTAPRSSFAEGVKAMRVNLTFANPDESSPVVLVTSPQPKDGKTVTAINTAIAFAQSGDETLLIDGDMRRPNVHRSLELDNETGFAEVLTGDADVSEAVSPTEIDDRLDALTCGAVPPNPSELLDTEEFPDILGELRDRYDRIVIDSPPLAAVADALILSYHVDAVLLVLRYGETGRDLLGRSVEQLDAIGAPLVGTVLNDVDDTNGYTYYYRYSYEHTDDRRDEPRDESATRMAS